MAIDTSALGFTWDDETGAITPLDPPAPPRTPPLEPTSDRDPAAIEADVVAALRTVRDPELPVNIHDLGLIYRVTTVPAGYVGIEMTLTSPACPVAGSLPRQVESRVRAVEGVSRVDVELTWDPPWDPSRMSEAARLELGLV